MRADGVAFDTLIAQGDISGIPACLAPDVQST